jgi:hypothetical protein
MNEEKLKQIEALLEKAKPFELIPGTVILEAEIYHQIVALLKPEQCPESQEPEKPEPRHLKL